MADRARRFLFKKGKSKIGTMVINEKRKASAKQLEDQSKHSRGDESIQIVNLQRDSTS
jgi:hypothetical protein